MYPFRDVHREKEERKNNCSYLKANYAIVNIIRHKDVCIKYCHTTRVLLAKLNTLLFFFLQNFSFFTAVEQELQRQCFLPFVVEYKQVEILIFWKRSAKTLFRILMKHFKCIFGV